MAKANTMGIVMIRAAIRRRCFCSVLTGMPHCADHREYDDQQAKEYCGKKWSQKKRRHWISGLTLSSFNSIYTISFQRQQCQKNSCIIPPFNGRKAGKTKVLLNIYLTRPFCGDGGNRTRVREADHTGRYRLRSWLVSHSRGVPTPKLSGASH